MTTTRRLSLAYLALTAGLAVLFALNPVSYTNLTLPTIA